MLSKRPLINGPTILTIIRILLIAPTMIGVFMDNVPARVIAIACFVLASATDFVDGRWARRDKLVTDFGAFLDPLADKMLINLTFLALVVLNQIPVYAFGIILIRDFAVDGLRMIAAKKNITISASMAGKTKTTIQMITIISFMVNIILNNVVLLNINYVLLAVTLALTIYSGLEYLIKGRKLMI